MTKLTVLGISGSLKSTSSNTNILRAISQFRPEEVNFILFDGLNDLPHFNPEKEEGTVAVTNFRRLLKEVDGVVISTPEYAFGVPGVLKNALDWTVSSGELNNKPVIAISASPLYEGGSKALASLLLTLGALGTKMSKSSHLSIANVSKKISQKGELTDEQTIKSLQDLFDNLLNSCITSEDISA
jgi:chromate reductase